jgi:predicted DsbA family dithiol-disulfide isomerase
MADKIKLDIISDVVCPWCAIGYKRLEQAISELGLQDRVDIEWQPFQLNPHMPKEGQNVQEHITEKYGSSLEQQRLSQERMTNFGAELGFKFDYFDEMKIVNTKDAHILLDYAKEFGKQTELNMRLMTAFFGERKDVSDRSILIEELKAVGLNADEAMARLDSDDVRYQVQVKEKYWQSLGVSSVPTVVFNNKSALNGAQPVEVFKEVLTELLEK